jgi:hypothetical protein
MLEWWLIGWPVHPDSCQAGTSGVPDQGADRVRPPSQVSKKMRARVTVINDFDLRALHRLYPRSCLTCAAPRFDARAHSTRVFTAPTALLPRPVHTPLTSTHHRYARCTRSSELGGTHRFDMDAWAREVRKSASAMATMK